jgi:hypothetical protein
MNALRIEPELNSYFFFETSKILNNLKEKKELK